MRISEILNLGILSRQSLSGQELEHSGHPKRVDRNCPTKMWDCLKPGSDLGTPLVGDKLG